MTSQPSVWVALNFGVGSARLITLNVAPSSKLPSAAYPSRIKVCVSTSNRAAPSRTVWDGGACEAAGECPAARIAAIRAATDAPASSFDREFPLFRRIVHSYDRPAILPANRRHYQSTWHSVLIVTMAVYEPVSGLACRSRKASVLRAGCSVDLSLPGGFLGRSDRPCRLARPGA